MGFFLKCSTIYYCRVPRRPQHHVTSIQESKHHNALAEHGGGWRLVNMVRHDLDMSGLGPSFRGFCSSFNAQRMNVLPHAALKGHARPPPSVTPAAHSPSSDYCPSAARLPSSRASQRARHPNWTLADATAFTLGPPPRTVCKATWYSRYTFFPKRARRASAPPLSPPTPSLTSPSSPHVATTSACKTPSSRSPLVSTNTVSPRPCRHSLCRRARHPQRRQ
jgi:hypothetical protein